MLLPGRASFRLYDLLGGLCVRFGHEEYLERVTDLITKSGQQLIFHDRLAKWRDGASAWRRKWKDTDRMIRWKSSSNPKVAAVF